MLSLTTLLLATTAALGQTPPVVRVAADLVHIPVDEDAFPKEFRVADHQTYFLATDSVHGQELWRSDGTAAGTRLVVDLLPGALNSQIRPLDVVGDRLYFGLDGQLWITDGTDAGTSFIVNPGPLDSPYEIISGVTLGSRLLFVAAHEDLGRALWVSDGTAEGTVDLPFSFGAKSTPTDWTRIGDRVIFSTVRSFGGAELWISDGTPEGTEVLAETCFACFVSPSELVSLGDRVVFVARSDSHGTEPWVSDGTPEGTQSLADFRPGTSGSFPTSLTVLGDTAYGILRSGCSGADCIFFTQGTPESTRLAGHLFPPAAIGTPEELMTAGSTLYLRVRGDEDVLWALDGTGGAEPIASRSSLQLLGDAHGSLIFRNQSRALMATDGTAASTRTLATDLSAYQLAEVGDQILLAAQPFVDGLIRDSELWITDGSEMSASPLPEIHPPTSSSNPSQLVTWGDDLVWTGLKEDPDQRALWLLEHRPLQSEAPISLTTDLYPSALVADGDRLFAGADPGLLIFERDGSSRSIDTEGSASEMVPFQDGMLIATTRNLGQSLWLSGGTQGDTERLIDVNPEWTFFCHGFCTDPFPGHFPNNLTPLDDRTLFVAFASKDGPGQLWSTDGTSGGTRVVREFEMDPAALRTAVYDSPKELTRVGDWVYFTAFDRLTGREVWRTDSTTEGTRLVADVTPDGGTAEPILLTAWNPSGGPATAVWVLRDQNGDKLLRSPTDVPPRAELILDFEDPEIGGPGAQIHELVASGDLLYLAVTTPAAGRELWVSNGFRQGTRLIDLRTDNPRGSGVAELTAIPNGVYFAAGGGPDLGAGFEPWISRGTEADTFMVADLFPGPSGSDPGPGTLVNTDFGDHLYFAADNGEIGRELFVIELNTSAETCPSDRLCLQQGRFEITMDWHTASGASGAAQRVSSTEDSGLLWFFEADNWEAMVKVLDGCDLNDHFWVFAATSTDVGYTLIVEDLLTGERKTYSNPPGENAAAITDTEALAVCPQ